MTREAKLQAIKEGLVIDESSPSGLAWSKPGKKKAVGAPALITVDAHGYRRGDVNYLSVKAHQAVFTLTHGYIPAVIDHIDGDKLNNVASNLREVTLSENSQNKWKAKGYSKHRKSFVAEIRVAGVKHHLGSFKTEDEARAAYLTAKKIHHPTSPINKET